MASLTLFLLLGRMHPSAGYVQNFLGFAYTVLGSVSSVSEASQVEGHPEGNEVNFMLGLLLSTFVFVYVNRD